MSDPAPLVGQAIGDSLGMPFKARPSWDEELQGWDGNTFLPGPGLKPGQWSEGTLTARFILESLLNCGGYYPKDVADRYLAWYYRKGEMGKTTQAALERLNSGVPWNCSGIEGAEGNGSAVRSAPFGYYYQEDLITVLEFARMDARITHRSIEAEMGSAAVALAVALLCKQGPGDLIHRVSELLVDCRVKQGLQQVLSYQSEGIPTEEVLRRIGAKDHTTQTIPAAFASFLLTDSFEEAVRVAIRAGGDTDAIAGIAGALAGTHYGIDAIPKKWKDQVDGFNHLRRLEKKTHGPRSDILWRI